MDVDSSQPRTGAKKLSEIYAADGSGVIVTEHSFIEDIDEVNTFPAVKLPFRGGDRFDVPLIKEDPGAMDVDEDAEEEEAVVVDVEGGGSVKNDLQYDFAGSANSDLFLMQLPPRLPLTCTVEQCQRQTAAREAEKKKSIHYSQLTLNSEFFIAGKQAGSSNRGHRSDFKSSSPGNLVQASRAGPIGELLVYKSGKVKMKIGNVVYDVERGVQSPHVFEAASITLPYDPNNPPPQSEEDKEKEEDKEEKPPPVEGGKYVSLGHVRHNFVTSLDVDS